MSRTCHLQFELDGNDGAARRGRLRFPRGVVETPEQIVLSGFADPNGDGSQPPNCIRWAFIRESAA